MKKARDKKNNTGNPDIVFSGVTELERKQWHGPYFGSMRLELMQNREGCVYEGGVFIEYKAVAD